MSTAPKTIQIFLPTGDPRGIRIAEITTRIVQAIEVPRSLLKDFLKMPQSKQVGLYFLFGEAEDGTEPKVYVGQTGELSVRLPNHNLHKEFWQRVVILIARTDTLTLTHALFLEWYCLQAAQQTGRFTVENGNDGSKTHTPPPLEADCVEFFELSRVLMSTLGYPLFEPVAKPVAQDDDEVFSCTSAGCSGFGLYTEEGFVVLKGSTGRLAYAPSFGDSNKLVRDSLIKSGVIHIEDDKMVFDKDHSFGSPSKAATILVGRPMNGWVEWKNKNGESLDALKRQPVEDAT